MEWEFMLPVKLVFGNGKRKEIEKYIDILGGKNGVLVCGKSFTKNGVADEFVKMSGGKIKKIFSDVRANPTTDNVDSCVKIMREINADFAIALGGACWAPVWGRCCFWTFPVRCPFWPLPF